MPRLLQFVALIICLAAVRPTSAFSLLGTFEAWQTPPIGYNLPGDIGAPKNLGEEFRWNVPVITYAFDSSFINYFGNEGVAAIDAAFNILNSLPDLTTLSRTLSEYPLVDPATGATTSFRDARRINLRAEADNLLDIKSTVLGMLVEQLGLASPERWVFAMADRQPLQAVTNYLVIQRNFDPVTTGYSKYVNGIRYTYSIIDTDNPQLADPVEATVDPEHRLHAFSTVANVAEGSLSSGIYYSSLSRDDIGGLRYIYDTNNVNWEPFPPNTQMFAVDRANGFVSVTNQDLTLLSLRSLTSSSNLLQTFYPGLSITQAIPNGIQFIPNYPVVVTQAVSLVFTTNFASPVIVSNIDLSTFSSVTLTSAPANLTANLQAAFPGVAGFDQLITLSTNFSSTTVVTAASVTLTNAPRRPFDDPFSTNFVFVTNYVTNIQILYFYTFKNVQTNYSSPVTTVQEITTGIDREPWSDALNPVYRTNVQQFTIDRPSGGILVIPTNLVGYIFTDNRITNVVQLTNSFFTTNFVDFFTGLPRTATRAEVTLFTNVQYFAYPIEFLANPLLTNTLATNRFVSTNIETFRYAYGNVITNYAFPNTPGTRVRLQVTQDPNNPAFFNTNVLEVAETVLLVPSGGFFVDTNLTGFELSGFATTTVIPSTVILSDSTDAAGVRTVEEVFYNFTNTVYLAFPFVLTNPPASVLRPGISKIRFQRIGGTSFNGVGFGYTNRYTASFFTNGVLSNAVFQVVQALPDILISAADLPGNHDGNAAPTLVSRTAGLQNNAALNSVNAGEGGPGTIFGPITLTLSKLGPSLLNSFPGSVTEVSTIGGGAFRTFFLWGSFDGSTNAPIVYPKDITLEEIELLKTGGAVP